jgi:hypothetical protein
MSKYRKFLVALGAAVALVASALADGVFTSQETEAIVLAIVSAVFVYLVPNEPTA